MKTSGQYEKPLSGSRGFPQLACSPGICRLITVLILFLDTNTSKERRVIILIHKDGAHIHKDVCIYIYIHIYLLN